MKNRLIQKLNLFGLCLVILSSTYGQDLKKIDKYIEKARKTYNVPGMSVGIVKDGEIFLSKGYGTIEKGKSEEVDENTLFAIASNTKAFVSSAIATLVSEGKLEWNDRVKDHLERGFGNAISQEKLDRLEKFYHVGRDVGNNISLVNTIEDMKEIGRASCRERV